MENFVTLLIPGLLSLVLIRALLLPLKLALKLGIHCGCGLTCLWLLNAVSGYTGILFPVNAATVLIAGVLGLPGMGLMAVLSLI